MTGDDTMGDQRDDFSRRLAEQLRLAEAQRKAMRPAEDTETEAGRGRTFVHPAQAVRTRLAPDKLPWLNDER